MLTIVALLVLSGIAGAVVVWSMSWEGAWPGTAGAGRDDDRHAADPAPAGDDAAAGAAEPLEEAPWTAPGGGAPPSGRRVRGRAAREAGAGPTGIPAAVAMMEHGEAYAPPSILGRIWAMLRLVMVVALTCGIVAGTIYWVASTVAKAVGHGG